MGTNVFAFYKETSYTDNAFNEGNRILVLTLRAKRGGSGALYSQSALARPNPSRGYVAVRSALSKWC